VRGGNGEHEREEGGWKAKTRHGASPLGFAEQSIPGVAFVERDPDSRFATADDTRCGMTGMRALVRDGVASLPLDKSDAGD
jgi:hypothetical protein